MRKSFKPAVLALVIGAACAGPAFAEGDGGDNGMSPWYGDSWAALQAHDPAAAPTPALAAQEDAAEGRAAWSNARDHMRATSHRWRENTSNMFHRMTGTSTAGTSDTTGTGGSYGGSAGATGGASGSTGTYGASGSRTYPSTGMSGMGSSDAVTTGARGTSGTNTSTTPNADSARTDNPYDGKAPPAMSDGNRNGASYAPSGSMTTRP